MSTANIRETLLREIQFLPVNYYPQVLDFIGYLKTKRQPEMPETEVEKAESGKMSEEEYLEGIRSLRGILTGAPDYSDLRDETDREL